MIQNIAYLNTYQLHRLIWYPIGRKCGINSSLKGLLSSHLETLVDCDFGKNHQIKPSS